jgi:ADP-ribosylglycohydrolase
MADSHGTRLARARVALEGLSVADALGAFFEFNGNNNDWIQSHYVPQIRWHYTDDTNMALSLYTVLRDHARVEQDALAHSFGLHYDRTRGYGMSMHKLLPRYANGENWRDLAPRVFRGTGSYGNGGAMRIAPLGAYYADDMNLLVAEAEKATVVTHAHPEAIAGATAAAVMTAFAFLPDAPTTPADFIMAVASHTPESHVRDGLMRGILISADTSLHQAAEQLGNGRHISAMDTVPLTVWITATRRASYPDAIWACIEAGGDADTLAAITGGAVIGAVGQDGVPADWQRYREPLPEWAVGV